MSFREALRTRDFTLSAEPRLDSQSSAASIAADASILRPWVDAVQVTDNPGGRVHLSPLVAAGVLLDSGIDPVLHLSCRDRNRIALQSDLLGAAALGVETLLLLRGQKFPADFPVRTRAVFDLGANGLIRAARSIPGESAGDEHAFFLGSVATAFNPARSWRPRKLEAKADAGVRFIQTQLCLDIDLIQRYMAGLVSAKLLDRFSVIVGVAAIPSVEVGEWLAENLRGSAVPRAVRDRIRRAPDPEREGITICAEMLEQLADVPGVSGANLVSFGDAAHIARAIELSGLRN